MCCRPAKIQIVRPPTLFPVEPSRPSKPQRTTQPWKSDPIKPTKTRFYHTFQENFCYIFRIFNSLFNKKGLDHPAKHARLAQSVERETLTSTRSQGCGF